MSSIWVEKFKPKKLDDLVLVDRIKTILQKIIKDKDIGLPIMLYGDPGIGKTALTNVLLRSIKTESLTLNGSLNTSIDDIRNKVEGFAKTSNKYGDFRKILHFDEADRLSSNAMDSLKALINDTAESCSYIFNTNYINRFPEPIISRFTTINLIPTTKEEKSELMKKYFKRLCEILTTEEVIFDKKIIIKIIKKYYPDFRKTLSVLQEAFIAYTEIDDNALEMQYGVNDELLSAMLKSDTDEILSLITTISPQDFYTEFYKKIKLYIKKDSIPTAVTILADWASKHSFTPDKELNLAGCIFELLSDVDFINGE